LSTQLPEVSGGFVTLGELPDVSDFTRVPRVSRIERMSVGFMWFVVADRREHYYTCPQDGESARRRGPAQ
jgi:hypothetical protein